MVDETFEDFTPAQKKSIVDIHKGNNILVSSPTGSGKTLTAFLSILSELTTLSQKGELEDKVYCIYISPLKALDNDIEKNLEEPLKRPLKKLQERIWESERPSEQVTLPNIKDRKCLKSPHTS